MADQVVETIDLTERNKRSRIETQKEATTCWCLSLKLQSWLKKLVKRFVKESDAQDQQTLVEGEAESLQPRN